MALGSLIIKEQLGLTDRETVEQIKENPYLQYFIGLTEYQENVLLDASTLVHFRKRMPEELVNRINEEMVKRGREKIEKKEEVGEPVEEIEGRKNQGKLILDATCAPADIRYPTDLGLLNEARKETERIIDNLYKPLRGKLRKKPRTSRKIARKEYLKVAKKRKVSYQERRKAIGKPLKYVKNNLRHIEELIQAGSSLKKSE
jgi:IS5 family transposase